MGLERTDQYPNIKAGQAAVDSVFNSAIISLNDSRSFLEFKKAPSTQNIDDAVNFVLENGTIDAKPITRNNFFLEFDEIELGIRTLLEKQLPELIKVAPLDRGYREE